MDKNFINIDDLVRQRLGGGEEQERSGSWMRMRELLDEEMPKAKPVGMYWRRMFGAIAVLLLIGGVTLGGYELNAYRNSSNTATNDMIAANTATTTTSSANTSPASTPATTATNSNESVSKTNSTTEHNKQINASETKNTNSTSENNKQVNANDVKNTHASPAVANHVIATHAKHATAGVDKKMNGNKTDKGVLLAANNEAKTITEATKTTTDTKTTTLNSKEVNSKEVAMTDNKVATDNKATTNNKAATNSADKVVKKGAHKHSGSSSTSIAKNTTESTANIAIAETSDKSADIKNALAVNNDAHNDVKDSKNTAGKKETPGALALGSTTPSSDNAKPVAGTKSNSRHKKTGKDKLALGSHTPAAKDIATVSADKVIDNKKPSVAKKDIKLAANDKSTNTAIASKTPAKKEAKKTASGTPVVGPAANVLASSTSPNTTSNPVVANKRKGSRQVEKLTISQRYVKTSPTTGYMHLDTISSETVTEEYDLAVNNYEPTVFGPPPYDQPAKGPRSHTVVTIDSRENNLKGKRNNSTSTIENLSAAFNDMKNKVSGVHFATGLTAGINGTFFGPNSFKGFQFGVTGTFTFSDQFSVTSELKYVHRINNDYTMNDNYYNYTPDPNGGYQKAAVLSSYSFSTLHSFELPISARYCTGNFKFFAGPNFEYTFAVNTGAASLPDPTATSQQVGSIGNDNAPKLKADDFGARFGIGYLLGLSYQLTPNVTFDLRNVQTVWDNATSAGAKTVSSQLYKSPSLQLSIGYRLGNNKNRGKE